MPATSTRCSRSSRSKASFSRPEAETIFLGGGTPTFTEPAALERLLAGLPDAAEVTVEANPETVTPELAALLRRNRVNRVSLGAQSFQPGLLEVLERVAGTDDVRRAVYLLRDADFDNISLDLIYGIPGQSSSQVERDLAEALALEPEHLSAYELEAKPGTRFTHAHGAELARQAESMESYFELVVETLTGAGYRWYETANFCQAAAGDAPGKARDLRSRHNLGYWLGHDYLGLGVGAVSTIENRRWRNAPSIGSYLEALEAGGRPPREPEALSDEVARDRARHARASARRAGHGCLGLARPARAGQARAARARELRGREHGGQFAFVDRGAADGRFADREGAVPRRRRDGPAARLTDFGWAVPVRASDAGPRLR